MHTSVSGDIFYCGELICDIFTDIDVWYLHMKYLAYEAYLWHMGSIFVVGTYMAVAWEVRVAVRCFLSFCKVMWGLYIEYGRSAVEHVCTVWQTYSLRGICKCHALYAYQCSWSHC